MELSQVKSQLSNGGISPVGYLGPTMARVAQCYKVPQRTVMTDTPRDDVVNSEPPTDLPTMLTCVLVTLPRLMSYFRPMRASVIRTCATFPSVVLRAGSSVISQCHASSRAIFSPGTGVIFKCLSASPADNLHLRNTHCLPMAVVRAVLLVLVMVQIFEGFAASQANTFSLNTFRRIRARARAVAAILVCICQEVSTTASAGMWRLGLTKRARVTGVRAVLWRSVTTGVDGFAADQAKHRGILSTKDYRHSWGAGVDADVSAVNYSTLALPQYSIYRFPMPQTGGATSGI